MGACLLLIFLIGSLLLIVCVVDSFLDPRKRAQEPAKKKHIDDVRDAAFAVIEASIQSEPEKWKPQFSKRDKKKALWLTNLTAGLALWLPDGPENIFVLRKVGQKFSRRDGEVLEVPKALRPSLYTVAMSIVSGSLEKREISSLNQMVDCFKIALEEKSNDASAA